MTDDKFPLEDEASIPMENQQPTTDEPQTQSNIEVGALDDTQIQNEVPQPVVNEPAVNERQAQINNENYYEMPVQNPQQSYNQPQYNQPQYNPQQPQYQYNPPQYTQPQYQPQANTYSHQYYYDECIKQPNMGAYPPPVKKSLSTGAKVFIHILGIIAIVCVTIFATLAISYASAPKPESSSSYDDFLEKYKDEFGEDFDDYFGDFYGEYGSDEEGEESPEDNITDEEIIQPDIEITPYDEGITIGEKPTTEELTAQEVYEKVIESVVSIDVIVPVGDVTYESSGTGFFLTEDGYILTNSHVINDTKDTGVTVITNNGEELPAIIVALDKTTDIAILKVDGNGYKPAEFASSDGLDIGEWVIAIGSPGGYSFSGSLTRGVISGLDREVGSYSANGMTYIQTDTAVNPGNSGGPLVNMYGQVVGITSSKIVAEYFEGMGFAIPINDAESIIEQLLSKGYVEGRTRLGITASSYNDGKTAGIEVVSIDEISSFAGTDTQVGDVLTAVDGESFTSVTELSNRLLSYSPGDEVEITIYRPKTKDTFDITITLLADNGETQ